MKKGNKKVNSSCENLDKEQTINHTTHVECHNDSISEDMIMKKTKRKYDEKLSDNKNNADEHLQTEVSLVKNKKRKLSKIYRNEDINKIYSKTYVENCDQEIMDTKLPNNDNNSSFSLKRDSRIETVEKKKSMEEENCDGDSDDDAPIEISSKVEIPEPKVKTMKQKKKKLNIILTKEIKNEEVPKDVRISQPKVKSIKQMKSSKDEEDLKQEKNNIKYQKPKSIDLESLPESVKKKILKKQERRKRQLAKIKMREKQKQNRNFHGDEYSRK